MDLDKRRKLYDMHLDLRIDWKRTEWPTVKEQILSKYHANNHSFLLLPEMEAVFVGPLSKRGYHKRNQLLKDRTGWYGISHQVGDRLQELIDKRLINEHLDKCRGIITLSNFAQKEWLREFPFLHIEVLKHPFPERDVKFQLDDKGSYGIRSLGQWKRKFDIWDTLNSPYPKIDGSHIRMLPNDEFDNQFRINIQFMDVVDASANNGVLECIRRNTPLLINRHPAVVEYLGEAYPFYFENLEDANQKINTPSLIVDTHSYLSEMSKDDLSFSFFETQFRATLNNWIGR